MNGPAKRLEIFNPEVGAGLALSVDQATHRAEISTTAAGAAVAIPVAVFIGFLWFLHLRAPSGEGALAKLVGPAVAVAVLLTPFTDHAVLWTGLLMAGLTGYRVSRSAAH